MFDRLKKLQTKLELMGNGTHFVNQGRLNLQTVIVEMATLTDNVSLYVKPNGVYVVLSNVEKMPKFDC